MADQKRFLDYEGIRHLWSKINMQDYPNNDMLMSVIQAIDDTKLDKDALVQSDWDEVDNASLAYIKNRTHGRSRMIPDCQNATIPEFGYTPLNTWPSNAYETEAYNSFIKLPNLYGIMGGGSTTRRYNFSFTMTSGTIVMDYSYRGDKIQANATMIDDHNYKCNIATDGSLALFFINNLSALSDEYKDTFEQPGIYLYCSSETYRAGLSNIDSMVYNYWHLDTDYLSSVPENLIPDEIARTETVDAHTSNETIHVTTEEKEAWNSAATTVSNLNQGLVLTDTVTGTNYRVTIAKGKVTLVEVSE